MGQAQKCSGVKHVKTTLGVAKQKKSDKEAMKVQARIKDSIARYMSKNSGLIGRKITLGFNKLFSNYRLLNMDYIIFQQIV